MGNTLCPKCNKDDQIQKVSSIYSGGTAIADYDTYAGRRTAVSTTNLAKKLSPPPKPKLADEGWSSCSGLAVFAIAGVILGFIVRAISSVISPATKESAFPFIIGFLIGFFGLILLIKSYSAKQSKKLEPIYKNAVTKWNELYYCYRDDCVFDPSTNESTSSEEMDRLLYK